MKHKINLYASGSGAIDFTHQDKASNQITGKEARQCLKRKENQHLALSNRLVKHQGYWMLIPRIRRVDAKTILWKGKVYTIALEEPVTLESNTHTVYQSLTATVFEDNEYHEVRHISTKSAIAFFLIHEEQLYPDPIKRCADFVFACSKVADDETLKAARELTS
jgi:hypothetical protein